MIRKYLLLFGLFISGNICAKFYVPETEDQFYKYINRHGLAIVHTNPFLMGDESKKMQKMKDAFYLLSKKNRYRNIDMAFVGVNIQHIPEVAQDLAIELPLFHVPEEAEHAAQSITDADEAGKDEIAGKTKTAAATDIKKSAEKNGKKIIKKADKELEDKLNKATAVIIFDNGKEVARRTGYLTSDEIEKFIESKVGTQINNLLQENERIMRQRQAIRLQIQPQETEQVYYVRQPQTYYYTDYDYPSYGYYPRRWWGGYGWPRYRRWWGGWDGWGWGSRRRGLGFGIGFGF